MTGSRRVGVPGARAAASGLILAAVVVLVVSLLARMRPVSGLPSLVLAVGAPYLAVGAFLGLAVAFWRRRTVPVLAALLLAAAMVAVQVSWYYLGRPSRAGEHAEIRVLMANIDRGRVDAGQFVAAAGGADVITVAELTPEAVRRITAAGIGRDFPHSHLIPGPEAEGIGIWSRYPLSVLSLPRRAGAFLPAARLRVPGVRVDPVVAAVHVFSPVADRGNTIDTWRDEMAATRTKLDDLATAAGPGAVIVGGDFNATPDVRQFRDLLTGGYREAVDQSGSGFAPTFPADAWYPPLITIDHVLTRRAVATSVRTIAVDGTDHRLVLASVEVAVGQ